MENRGRKRAEMSDQLPANKHACSSNDHRPSSFSQSSQIFSSSSQDCTMESSSITSSSCPSDRDSVISGDSDEAGHDNYHFNGVADTKMKFSRIFSELSSEGACSSKQLAALTELCDILLLCSENNLSGFAWDTFVPILVNLSQHVDNPDIVLFSIRSMTYLCDVVPRSAMHLVKADAIPALVAPLLCIEYLDVAEQCLQVLEKISRLQPNACLQAGCVMAALNYIDFFSTNIQKVAISLVANICGKLPSDSTSFDLDAIPVLCNLLQYDDKKLVETSAICLVKIVETLCSQTMDKVFSHGLIQQSVHLIALKNRMMLSESTYRGLIGMLARLASASSAAIKMLFELNICAALKNVLLTSDIATVIYDTNHGEPVLSQVHEALKLLNVLLPPLDQSGDREALSDDWRDILGDQRQHLHDFGTEILPSLIQVVGSAANTCVCYGCLCVIHKIVAFSNVDSLLKVLEGANISSFLANIYARNDRHVLISGLKTAELLLHKLPEFYRSFVKEGVLFAVDALQDPEKSSQNLPASNQKVGAILTDVSGCFCYAFDIHRPTSPESMTCKIKDLTVQGMAEHIKAAYFTGMMNNPSCVISGCLQKLRNFSTSLASSAPLLDMSSINKQQDVLHNLMEVISDKQESVSIFELVESGIVRSVVDYLSGGCPGKETIDYDVLFKRFGLFMRVSLISTSEQCKELRLTSLVQKLQSALSVLEHFPVIVSYTPQLRTVYSNIPYPHYTRHPCLKIRFMKKEGEIGLREFCQEVQLVEAFSYFDDLDRFLWPKVSCGSVNGVHEGDARSLAHKSKADSSLQRPSSSTNAMGIGSEAEKPRVSMEVHTEKVDVIHAMPNESSFPHSAQKMKLIFYLGGKPLDSSLTLWQSIMQHFMTENDAPITSRFWSELYTVVYGKAETSKEYDSKEVLTVHVSDCSGERPPILIKQLVADVPWELDRSNPTHDILLLLKMLEAMNRYAFDLMSFEKNHAYAEGRIDNFDQLTVTIPTIPQMEFINCKLSDKLEQQMQDPLAMSTAGMPLWCNQLVTSCPFLFSFESRRKYFQLALSSSTRVSQTSMHNRGNYSSSGSSNERRLAQSVALARAKFQVSRHDILGSASKMMAKYARSDKILEVEFIQEVGSGLGPTMEFYTLVSYEFQKTRLGMWRDDHYPSVEGCQDFVASPLGLFPRPWASSVNEAKFSDVIRNFVLLGQIVAKALHDGRVMDLPLSKAFYKLVIGQELDIYDITTFDPGLGRFLVEFQALASRKKFFNANIIGDPTNGYDLCFRDSSVEDLGLDFTLPGYNDYILACGPDYVMVNVNNLGDYVSLVVDATVKSGISRQLEAFKLGFNQVLPLDTLKTFTEDEFEHLLCGEKAYWISGDLREHIKFDHGYTASSPPVIFLLEILEEFEVTKRRAFLQFVTGAPRLPLGGLAALNPKLTIVRKNCSNFVDGDLPSVMTCANYLKLPPYSTKELMLERLLYAITEGQGSFHLS